MPIMKVKADHLCLPQVSSAMPRKLFRIWVRVGGEEGWLLYPSLHYEVLHATACMFMFRTC